MQKTDKSLTIRMMDIHAFDDTIAAISTPLGRSGIGIVRLSGPEALSVADRVFKPANPDRSPLTQKTFTTCYGHVTDGDTVIDEAILTVMRAPGTYTTQDVVEINCHGGIVPLRRTLELVLEHDARLADPGEFTKRAYYFGRIDLAQAEAVADIITARTEESQQAAMQQLSGRLSDEINRFREAILDLLSQIEASIDFIDQDIDIITSDEIARATVKLIDDVNELLDTARRGQALREGLKVAIVGRPNVGKSSLLNALVNDARAIVTEVPGTTRDVIEDTLDIQGIPVTLADTAGLRDTEDLIEAEGVERAESVMAQADLVLLVIDTAQELTDYDRRLLRQLAPDRGIVVMNKEDLPTVVQNGEVGQCTEAPTIWISAKEGTHLQELEEAVASTVWEGKTGGSGETLVTNVRHKNALQKAAEALKRADRAFAEGYSEEFIASDLREALHALDEIVGKFLPEELLDSIFSRFCIGK
ncbi:MAG: tRNA uridine-5-carboxymethylaminomethyl(34) synthesis GTPase MnmE [Armatimonadota bacterium]